MPCLKVTQYLFHSMLLVNTDMGWESMWDAPSLEKNNQLDRVIREALCEEVVSGPSPEGGG